MDIKGAALTLLELELKKSASFISPKKIHGELLAEQLSIDFLVKPEPRNPKP